MSAQPEAKPGIPDNDFDDEMDAAVVRPGGDDYADEADSADRSVVELAIERALNTVAAELEQVVETETTLLGARARPLSDPSEAGDEMEGVFAPEEASPETSRESGGDAAAQEPTETPSPRDALARLAAVAAARREMAEQRTREAPVPIEPPVASRPAPEPAVRQATAQPAPQASAEADQADAGHPLTHLLARMSPPTSVEELGRAVEASGGPSLDKMMEDMIRPVVREWLTNNLSTLAERIVREEIERVSRPND